MALENVNVTGLGLRFQIGFQTLKLLTENLPNTGIIVLSFNDCSMTLTSRHVYHIILLIHQAGYLYELDFSSNTGLAECASFLLKFARNVDKRNMIKDEQLLEMGGPVITVKYHSEVLGYINNNITHDWPNVQFRGTQQVH